MRCRQARRAIRLVVDGELSLEDRLSLDAHLAGCERCLEQLRSYQRLEEVLEALPEPPVVQLDLDRALAAVNAGIDRAEGSERSLQESAHLSSAFRPSELPHDSQAGIGIRLRRTVAVGLVTAAAVSILLGLAYRDMSGGALESSFQESTLARPISFDHADRAKISEVVRGALLRSYGDEEDDDAAIRKFDEAARSIASAGWSVLRFVEAVTTDEDPSVVVCAVRYLGQRGDARSATCLRNVAAVEELRPQALLAMESIGQPAIGVLGRMLEDSEQAVGALRALVGIGGEEIADLLDGLLERKRRGERIALSRPLLLDGLSQTGPHALLRLLDLIEAGRATEEEIFSRIALVEGGEQELVRQLQAGREPTSNLYIALSILQPPAALPWLEERCEETRERERALGCLSGWSGLAPCASLLRLYEGGRVEAERIVEAMRALASQDPESITQFTDSLILQEARGECSVWLELLFEVEHVAVSTSMAMLALADLLDRDERQWAALGVGELGDELAARVLVEGFHALETGERRVRAACLLSIHALLGTTGVEHAFEEPPARLAWSGLLSSLEDSGQRGRLAYGLHRVVRALDRFSDSSTLVDSHVLP